MENELKPCPFCGCANIMMLHPEDEYSGEEREAFWFIYCPDCVMETGVYHDEKILADLWNRRAADGTAK